MRSMVHTVRQAGKIALRAARVAAAVLFAGCFVYSVTHAQIEPEPPAAPGPRYIHVGSDYDGRAEIRAAANEEIEAQWLADQEATQAEWWLARQPWY